MIRIAITSTAFEAIAATLLRVSASAAMAQTTSKGNMRCTLEQLDKQFNETLEARWRFERELKNYAPPVWASHRDVEAEKERLEVKIAQYRDEEDEILFEIANLGRKTPLSYLKSATWERLREEAMGRRWRRRMVNRGGRRAQSKGPPVA
jgi:hypothetical protein